MIQTFLNHKKHVILKTYQITITNLSEIFFFFFCWQVYEEKQKRSELEMEELRQSCATKMQKASQKAQRAQQLLQFQFFQLQQEKKKLHDEFTQVLQERDRLEERCASFEREHTQLGPRLEETKWEVR